MDPDQWALYADESSLERARLVQESARAWRPPPPRSPLSPGLSVVVLNLDRPKLILPLLDQLDEQRGAFAAAGESFEVLVGDTGSTDERVLEGYRERRGRVRLEEGLRYQFSECNNHVASLTSTELVLFLNNDVILPSRPDALFELTRGLTGDPATGVLGAVLWFPDGRLQHAGVDFFRQPPLRGFPYHAHARERIPPDKLPATLDAPATTGSFLLVRRRVFDEVGGFSPDYVIEAQDIDLCLKVHRAGLRTRVRNLGHTVHLENATRPKGEEHWPDRRLFLRRWRTYVEANFL